MTLIYAESKRPVKVGDRVQDFRGDQAEVTGMIEPRSAASSGKVRLRYATGWEQECYVTVIGAVWIGRTDR